MRNIKYMILAGNQNVNEQRKHKKSKSTFYYSIALACIIMIPLKKLLKPMEIVERHARNAAKSARNLSSAFDALFNDDEGKKSGSFLLLLTPFFVRPQ